MLLGRVRRNLWNYGHLMSIRDFCCIFVKKKRCMHEALCVCVKLLNPIYFARYLFDSMVDSNVSSHVCLILFPEPLMLNFLFIFIMSENEKNPNFLNYVLNMSSMCVTYSFRLNTWMIMSGNKTQI